MNHTGIPRALSTLPTAVVECVDFLIGTSLLSMLGKRYSVIIANRTTGSTHRLTLGVAPMIAGLLALLVLPTGLLVYAEWSTSLAVTRLRGQNARLQIENAQYRSVASDLTEEMGVLDAAMDKLARRVDMDPALLRSMSRLPDSVQVGIPQTPTDAAGQVGAMETIRALLGDLSDRLTQIRRGVAYREALAAATPVIWPAAGWISGTYGYRSDPFTGERDFHPALDISSQRGQPVYATATGRVLSAERNGAYGNLVEIDHGFGLVTRYGHLSEFALAAGDTVQRGGLIGYVGATGRATGHHVHYEIWSNGRTVNPMQLLTETRVTAAN